MKEPSGTVERMNEKRYLVIEGPIGVGKTTLCKLLCKRWKAREILEEVEENPFLPDFYRNRRIYGFQTQIFFLLSRFRQQEKLLQLDLFEKRIVSDYMFAKDRIFASVNLSESEYQLYLKLADLLEPRLVKPDLVIYLQASPDVLLQRIARRGRYFERDISISYLQKIVEAYNDYFFRSREQSSLIVNTDSVDFSEESGNLDGLVYATENHRGGTESYVPRLE